jgi:hypothetical protein
MSIAIGLGVLTALCSCTREPTYLGPEATIEGVWRSDSNHKNRLFLGADQWSLFELEPERLVIDGRFVFDDSASNVRTVKVRLRDATTQYAWQQTLVADYNDVVLHLNLNIERNKLTIVSEEQANCKLVGSYHYYGQSSPVKGKSTVREWGEYMRNTIR